MSPVVLIEFTDGDGEIGGGGGAKSYDGEKALSSVKFSILSGCAHIYSSFSPPPRHIRKVGTPKGDKLSMVAWEDSFVMGGPH